MSRKLTTSEFIERARAVHGDAYDYSKSVYDGIHTPLTIICNECGGEFSQMPNNHFHGEGCPRCGHAKKGDRLKKTTGQFVEDAKAVHGDKYDYSLVAYEKCDKKVDIICPKHGVFSQKPFSHLQGAGCPKCGRESSAVTRNRNGKVKCPHDKRVYRYTTESFIERAREVHGDLYSYDKVDYVSSSMPVIITCREHGDFEKRPSDHLRGLGCPKCGWKKMAKSKRMDTSDFIEKAREVHGGTYDYSKTVYVDSRTPLIITCCEHGDFETLPIYHLSGKIGCPKCSSQSKSEMMTLSQDEFLRRAREVHGDTYSYDKSEFKGIHEHVIITCPKHGDFSQKAAVHLIGCGCPKCNNSSLERQVASLLDGKYEMIEQASPKWLGRQFLDFYLPKQKIAIECQGLQHFVSVEFFGGDENFETTRKRDERKRSLCEANGVTLLYFGNACDVPDDWNAYPVITDEAGLLKEIDRHSRS